MEVCVKKRVQLSDIDKRNVDSRLLCRRICVINLDVGYPEVEFGREDGEVEDP